MIIERAPLPIVEVQGSAHTVTHVNSAFCRLLGKSREDLIGKSFADIVHGGDKCVPSLDRVYQTGEAATLAQEDDSDSASWLYAMWPALDANEQAEAASRAKDDFLAALSHELLTRGGHQVTTAGTIAAALAAFAAAHFDAVISDLGLPDGSGLDLMRQIQRQRPVPGIALSGYGMEDDLRQTKEVGFFAHLVKPVSLDQLRQLLNQLTA